jgi:hypothetical protein
MGGGPRLAGPNRGDVTARGVARLLVLQQHAVSPPPLLAGAGSSTTAAGRRRLVSPAGHTHGHTHT